MRIISWFALSVLSSMAVQAAVPMEGNVEVAFSGSATMGHFFKGAVTSETFRVTYAEGNAGKLADFTVEVAAASLTTFHKKRDREMKEHFQAEKFPKITGVVKNFDWSTLEKTEPAPSIPFTFSFAGGTVPLTASVSHYAKEADGSESFDAAFSVSQAACGCKRISMMGFMKVHDEVPVVAHFKLKPSPKP